MVKCLHKILPISLFLDLKITKDKKNKFNKWFLIISGIVLFFIFSGFLFLFFLGSFLSPQDKLEKADVIVVVSGGETFSRTQKAVELYKDNWAPKIIVSGAARSGEISNAMAMKSYAIKKGVLAKDIFIEEESNSTYENALFSKEIIEENNFKKIILVTSPYHQRRTYMNFRFVLGPDYQIINQSSSDSNWSSSSYFESKKNIKTTFDEFSRIMYLLFTKDYSREVY